MLSEEELYGIREHLDRAQNPIFFYDNDPDGLCSYVLFRKYLGRGKGVAVRTHPALDTGYARKTQELNADYVFVLDRPYLGKEFVDEISKMGLPIVWIDHHAIENEEYDYANIYRFNPNNSSNPSNEPVTYWAYKVCGRREDMWIAMMGCVADHHYPDFSDDFSERHGEYWGKDVKEPFDVYYKTEIGRLARSLSFGLKDSITHVVQLQNSLINCRDPSEMALLLESNKAFGKKYREIKKKYDALILKAKACAGDKLLFFNYSGDLSISADISNQLSYEFPNHLIVVAYTAGPISNMSMRGDDVRGILENLLPGFEGASGGGHRDAVGARMNAADLDRFRAEILEELGKR